MQTQLDLRRILIFLAIAYGLAIAATIAVVMTGGLEHSNVLGKIGPLPISTALLLLAIPYMFAPAIAHALTRLITREGWAATMLRPQFRRGWIYWLIAFFHPALLVVICAAFYFTLFPQSFDAQMTFATQQMKAAAQQNGQALPDPAIPAIIAANAVIGIAIGSLFNCFFTFGEEFGWRSYLLTKLMPLGWRRAMLWMGLIWGTWHWPVLYLGYNYTLNNPGAPWSGMAAFILFTFAAGTILAWLCLKAGSVWPAVIGHGAINASAGLGILFAQGESRLLFGPLPFGLIAVIPWLLVAVWLWLRPGDVAQSVSTTNDG